MFRIPCRTPAVLLSVSALALAALVATPARATTPVSPGVNLQQLVAQVAALQNTVNTLQNTVNSQAATIKALQAKTAPISIQNGVGTNTEMFLTGVNLHIINGLGATSGNPADPFLEVAGDNAVVNGLGNLIIGYNESRSLVSFDTDTRTGSHNFILGDANDYTSYSSLVGGQFNSSEGSYASVIGGSSNFAIGSESVVVAGTGNDTDGTGSVVTAGTSNDATRVYAEVTGGEGNSAGGNYAVVVGGDMNSATGLRSVVTGGDGNSASGTNSLAP